MKLFTIIYSFKVDIFITRELIFKAHLNKNRANWTIKYYFKDKNQFKVSCGISRDPTQPILFFGNSSYF